jgi:hypothetical protein
VDVVVIEVRRTTTPSTVQTIEEMAPLLVAMPVIVIVVPRGITAPAAGLVIETASDAVAALVKPGAGLEGAEAFPAASYATTV